MHFRLIVSRTLAAVSLLFGRRFTSVTSTAFLPPRADRTSTTALLPIDSSLIMLLRVRSNVGTWKFSMEPSQTISEVMRLISEENNPGPWALTNPLSRDPTCQESLATNESLETLGLTHGTMIFCRVEPRTSEALSSASISARNAPSGSASMERSGVDDGRPASPFVMDLLDSSDDDDAQHVAAKPPVAQPKKRQRTKSTVDSPSNSSASKKPKPSGRLPSLSRSITGDPTSFQIASYNVWFGPPDPSVNQVHPQQRMAAIAQELQTCQNDLLFIGFQELTESLRTYLEPHLKAMGFRFCVQPLRGNYGVGLAISKRVEIVESKFLPFADTIQGRGLLYVETPTVLFGTTHLESFIDAKEYDGSAQRERQILQATAFFEDQIRQKPNLKLAIIAGDFNWDDERIRKGTSPNTALLDLLGGEWSDAGKRNDYTYDGKENPMLGGNLRRRFDRCIFMTTSSVSKTNTRLDKLGMTAIPNLTWNKKNPFNGTIKVVPVAPSDHFGIAVTFETN